MINLPKKKDGKPYLSYSQISVWKKSKNRRNYIRQYFLGEEEDNASLKDYADFGNKVGEALENNDFSKFTEEEQKFLKTVPRYDEFEREVVLDMVDFFMKGFIDTNSLSSKGRVDIIVDYKTGIIEKVIPKYEGDDYLQTDIYSAAIEQETGHLPKEAKVIIIQRDGNAFNGELLTLGDNYHIVEREVSRERIDKVLKNIREIAEEISLYYSVFLKLNQ